MSQYNGLTGNPLVGAKVANDLGVTDLAQGSEAQCCEIAQQLEKLMNINVPAAK
jgi:hypothetical protein